MGTLEYGDGTGCSTLYWVYMGVGPVLPHYFMVAEVEWLHSGCHGSGDVKLSFF